MKRTTTTGRLQTVLRCSLRLGEDAEEKMRVPLRNWLAKIQSVWKRRRGGGEAERGERRVL
jgi:hypothetical protein